MPERDPELTERIRDAALMLQIPPQHQAFLQEHRGPLICTLDAAADPQDVVYIGEAPFVMQFPPQRQGLLQQDSCAPEVAAIKKHLCELGECEGGAGFVP